MRQLIDTKIASAIAALAIVAVTTSGANAAPVLDQAQELDGAPYLNIREDRVAWQSFIPGFPGSLTSVDLRLSRDTGGANADLQVDIVTMSAGLPTSTVLGSTTIPMAAVPSTVKQWATATFSPIPLTEGVSYAIKVSSTGTVDPSAWHMHDINGNPYANGLEFAVAFTPTPIPQNEYDWTFRTYMEPDSACSFAAPCSNNAPGKAILSIHDDEDDAKDSVQLKWAGSFAGTDLGSPASTTSYTLCVFQNGSDVLQLAAPANVLCGTTPCWSEKGTPVASVKYKDKSKPPASDGITSIKGKAGAGGKAKLSMKAKGQSVPAFALGSALAYPVLARVVTSDAGCFEAAFTAENEKKNDGVTFKAVRKP
jgi:hypothetical protein